MIGKKNQKCFSPWFGFLVILAVCIVIASAIFFESKGSRRHRRAVHKTPAPVAMQAAFPNPGPGTGATDEKLAF
ncbi:MAG: hypothetical protein HQL18_00175 [Candidatus Omnitrophica bacterium]|nr:hypothetical protein [Candidatus Omnitrophota bacterium]